VEDFEKGSTGDSQIEAEDGESGEKNGNAMPYCNESRGDIKNRARDADNSKVNEERPKRGLRKMRKSQFSKAPGKRNNS